MITPSLDEMVFLAKEMERQNFNVPLLIGGATTSKAHTAVKIDPQYQSTVVHVNDASRAVTVVGDLLKKESADGYKKSIKLDYEVFRDKFLKRSKHKEYKTIQEARNNKFQIDWTTTEIVKPKELGIQVIDNLDLKNCCRLLIGPLFLEAGNCMENIQIFLPMRLLATQATELFSDAQALLQEVIDKKLLKAKAVFGLFPANSVNNR